MGLRGSKLYTCRYVFVMLRYSNCAQRRFWSHGANALVDLNQRWCTCLKGRFLLWWLKLNSLCTHVARLLHSTSSKYNAHAYYNRKSRDWSNNKFLTISNTLFHTDFVRFCLLSCVSYRNYSTHLCLASHKRDIGKQCRPRSDAAASGQGPHCLQ